MASPAGEALVEQAAALAADGQLSAAAALFEQACAADPGDAAAHEMLAQCRMELGQDEGAFEAAAAAAALRPRWRAALLTLGRAARNAGRLRDAAAAYASLLEVVERQEGKEEGGQAAGARPSAVPLESPLDEEELAAARQEQAEVRNLLQLQLGHQIGLPGLRLLERTGTASGPGGVAWEAGALLAWFLVQQDGGSFSPGSGGGGSGSGNSAAAGCGAAGCLQHAGSGGSNGSSSGGSALRGCSVLELGSGGTGLVGLAAACLGAHVTATDLPEVLPQLREAIAANAGLVAAGGGSVSAAALDWRSPDPSVLSPGTASLLPGEGQQQQRQQYEWLLGADLVYSLPVVAPLVATIASAAAASGSLDGSSDSSSPAGPTALPHAPSSPASPADPPASSQPTSLRILISHKHRHDDVDAALLGALRSAGVTLRAVLRDHGCRCTVYANDAAAAALRL